MRLSRTVTNLLLAPLAVLLLGAVLVPAAIFLVYSLLQRGALYDVTFSFDPTNYINLFTDPLYRDLASLSLTIAVPTTLLTVVAGYALAYFIAMRAHRLRLVFLSLVAISLLASFLVRIYAWRAVLGEHGVINSTLIGLGLTDEPVPLFLFSRVAVVLAEMNLLLPLVVLAIYANLSGISPELRDSARDLGSRPTEAFCRVTLPLTGASILAVTAVVFFLSMGDYITPQFLGGKSSTTIGVAISDALRKTGNYPLGAALSIVMIAGLGLVYVCLRFALRAASILPGRDGGVA